MVFTLKRMPRKKASAPASFKGMSNMAPSPRQTICRLIPVKGRITIKTKPMAA
jgi:hypothetical protein